MSKNLLLGYFFFWESKLQTIPILWPKTDVLLKRISSFKYVMEEESK